METTQLFAQGLGLSDPFHITLVELLDVEDSNSKSLHIHIDFYKGSTFKASDGNSYKVYDTRQRSWRHLDFFQHTCYLHCGVPRVKKADGKVEQIVMPWSRSGSGFTLLFESYIMQMIKLEMPVNCLARQVGEYADRLWTIFNYYVTGAYEDKDHKEVKQLGVDETSAKKGHNYVTTAVDMEKREVVHVTKGKDKQSIENIRVYLESKGCPAEQIEELSLDMSPSFIAGGLDQFPKAALTFDRFHVKKLLNKAVDEVRKIERKEYKELKGHKYIFLRNKENLKPEKQKELEHLLKLYPTIGKSYRFKVLFDEFWDIADSKQAEIYLNNWCEKVMDSKIFPMQKFVKTIKAHWYGIINYSVSRITNGILEGINTKIQLAKRRARGYRKIENFINMIYLIAGNLNLNHPHKTR